MPNITKWQTKISQGSSIPTSSSACRWNFFVTHWTIWTCREVCFFKAFRCTSKPRQIPCSLGLIVREQLRCFWFETIFVDSSLIETGRMWATHQSEMLLPRSSCLCSDMSTPHTLSPKNRSGIPSKQLRAELESEGSNLPQILIPKRKARNGKKLEWNEGMKERTNKW